MVAAFSPPAPSSVGACLCSTAAPPPLPDRYRGPIHINRPKCPTDYTACAEACPTGAIKLDGALAQVDLGRCLFCTACVTACPQQAITHRPEYRLSARRRENLVIDATREDFEPAAAALSARLRRLFGRSFKLRQVSAGGEGACEADTNVLTTIGWDLSRFGIQFVASPRHADGILVTGPVTKNMTQALIDTYEAVGDPRVVIAVGADAISGGAFLNLPDAGSGVAAHIPVDLYIPGNPPHPLTILDGLLRLIGRIEGK